MSIFLTKKFLGHIFVEKFENHRIAENHSHEYIELAYVLEGDGTTVINGKSEPIKKGDFYIIDYNSTHSYSSEVSDFKIINCLFFNIIDVILWNYILSCAVEKILVYLVMLHYASFCSLPKF